MSVEYSCGIVPLRMEKGIVEVLLIVHKGGRHWGFPKGHKDQGETDLETAKRELQEETGLTVVECLSKEPYREAYTFYKFRQKVRKVVCYFPAFVEGALVLQPDEITNSCWLPIESACERLTFKEAREICSKVIDLLKKQSIL
jgi:bis(5'-nucleosidyl)-tetraphosphatase